MEKSYQNEIAQSVIRLSGAPGLLKIFEWSDKKNERGTLLLFIEIEASDRDSEKIVKTLSGELTKQYFNALTESAEFAFEHALGRANIALKDILLAKPKSWLNKIHIIALAAVKAEAHLGSVGNVRALLVHRDRIVDILGGRDNGAAGPRPGRPGVAPYRSAVNPVKLFSQVVSGRITAEDSLILLNEAVLDYLSLERIRKTAQENHPVETASKLTELLSLAPREKQFGLIVVKRTAKTEIMPVYEPSQYEKGRLSPKSQATAEAEDNHAQNSSIIEQYLRPSEPQALQKGRDGRKEALRFIKQTGRKLLVAARWRGGAALSSGLTMLNYALSRLLSALARLPSLSLRAASLAKIMLLDPSGRKYYRLKARNALAASALGAKGHLLSWPAKTRTKWQGLTKKQKISLLGILSLGLLLAVSLTVRGRALTRQKYQADYQNRLTIVKEKSDQAEAALIYKDFALARQMGVEAINLIASLPQKTPAEKAQSQELKSRADALIDKLEKRRNLGALTPLLTIVPPPNGQNSALLSVGKNTYYVAPAEGKIAEINADKGLLLPLTINIGSPAAVALTVDDNHLLLSAADKSIADKSIIVNIKDETSAPRTIAWPEGATALAGYFKNIYALVPGEGKIWRWKEQAGKYGAAQNWLKENYDLANAVDLAVDGSLYLLSAGGEISVFENGRLKRRLTLTLLEPLGPRPRLYTGAALKHLYIFDPARQRIIQLDKNGDLRVQYAAAELKNGFAFAVDHTEENALFLAGDKIYRIPLSR